MADTPQPTLIYAEGCGDCGYRDIRLPEPLPPLGDDFDWLVRDYDGFRLFMMEELAARFSERRRWTPADLEVVIMECLAVVLDQQSDMLDRIFSEAFLETARQPASVRRLLKLIGYDATQLAPQEAAIPDAVPPLNETDAQRRQRLQRFHTALFLYGSDYATELGELSSAEQAIVQQFVAASDSVANADLGAVQKFLDEAPLFVQRARNAALERYWELYPRAMDAARAAGPHAIHTQKRMVTTADYGERLEDHPLVNRAHASLSWSGSWSTIQVAAVLLNNLPLDAEISTDNLGPPGAPVTAETLASLRAAIDAFHRGVGLNEPDWTLNPLPRTLLRQYVDAYRMAGQEVFLLDAVPVGINIAMSIGVNANYFQSEVRRGVMARLGTGIGGFFAPGRLSFGEDLHAGDLIEAVMALDGVEAVCLNRFKRVGKRYANQADAGRIELGGLEIGVCDNDPSRPERGYLQLTLNGGRKG